MPSQEEMRNEATVLFGQLDVLKKACETAAESIAEQERGVLFSFLNKYADKFPQVVFTRDEGYQTLTLARLLCGKAIADLLPQNLFLVSTFSNLFGPSAIIGGKAIADLPPQNLLLVPTFSNLSGPSATISCIIDEKRVYRPLPEINSQLSRDKILSAVRACISARLEGNVEVPDVVIPEGFLAFRFDAMWAAGGHDDDHPTTFEVVIEANDIHSGFETFKGRLLDGWWLGQKNFVGSFLIAFPPTSDHPHCGKWHRLELVAGGVKNPPVWGHYWSVEFDWHKAKLAEEPFGPFSKVRCLNLLVRPGDPSRS